VLVLVKVFADFHDRVQVLLLAEDLNGLLKLVCLLVEARSFLPVARVSLELSLLYKDAWIQERTVSFLPAVLADELVGFIELLERSEQSNGPVNHVVFYVMGRSLLVLALESEDFTLQPQLVQVLHAVHLFGQLAQVDKLEVSDPAKSFLGEPEVLVRQSLDAERSPVLLGNSEACKFVGHGEVFALKESEERRGLGHINGIHVVVVQTEDFGPFETHNVARKSLLLGRQVSALDEQRVLPGVGEHVLNFKVPSDRRNVPLLEEQLLGLDIVNKQTFVVIDYSHFLAVS